jgi:hypothetical protein
MTMKHIGITIVQTIAALWDFNLQIHRKGMQHKNSSTPDTSMSNTNWYSPRTFEMVSSTDVSPPLRASLMENKAENCEKTTVSKQVPAALMAKK